MCEGSIKTMKNYTQNNEGRSVLDQTQKRHPVQNFKIFAHYLCLKVVDKTIF